MDILSSQNSYSSLSVRDLLDARNQFHVHMLNKRNVVGTAVGLYLIRRSDPWPDAKNPVKKSAGKKKVERTFANSEVRPYSWPCMLVMVDEWVEEKAFSSSKLHPQDMVPKMLYLPDGRVVPVCVVKVEPQAPATKPLPSWIWPEAAIGGGFPLLIRNQGLLRTASAGCLVSDGHTIYALTNRHVCGEPGEPVHARLRGEEVEIGHASERQLTRLPFTEVYPSFAGKQTYLNLDVGLVEVDDARDWTSSVYGIGEVGALADLNEQNLGLQLIDHPVSAFGAASGHLEGRIKALFYRYKSVGGYDYVADLLIAPQEGNHQTQPGDSGTVWHLKSEEEKDSKGVPGKVSYRPLAVEWGAQTFSVDGGAYNFALATNLSNVCKLLDVELVSAHNTAAQPYWGATGHYSIGNVAVGQVKDKKLAKLLAANALRISFDRTDIAPGKINEALKDTTGFIALADVPDVIWKKQPGKVKGGRDTGFNSGPEHPTHYADIDIPGPNDGPSLRELCMQDTDRVAVEYWQGFYDSVGSTASKSRGCLPFRVWQFYDAMVGYVEKKDYASYVAAAGLLAHYVGDACQPLHGSFLADGYQDQATEGVTSTGKPKKDWPAKGVHSIYETKMIDAKAAELFEAIDKVLAKPAAALAKIDEGRKAAVATVKLMDDVARLIPPSEICDAYVELGEGASRAVIDGLWEQFGANTAKVMALGIRNLAHIWESAWIEGGGDSAKSADMVEFSEAEIRKRYVNPKFVPSLDLDQLAAVL
ncbi:S1/P1 Nuclease [Polaromonas sp. CT11-55]|uniref:S1/P1 Nuclease n=1 Tax=Polaromonas sp. CT11-55 TaxID=3243045 RepID=UPI0039A73C78